MRTITVTGIGEAGAAPDNIIISLTVNAQDADYEKAMELAADRLEALRIALSAAGFGKDDLKTVSFNVSTEYRNVHKPTGEYEREFAGYRVMHHLSLEFGLDLQRLSDVISAISGCKCAPELSVQFGLKDEEPIKAELLRSAAENARSRALVLAEASGVKLGTLVSIDYSFDRMNLRSATQFAMPMADGMLMKARAMPVDIAPQDITVTDSVTFVWEIV